MLLYFIRGFFIVIIIGFLFVSINYHQSLSEKDPQAQDLYRMGLEAEQKGELNKALMNYKRAFETRVGMEISGETVINLFIAGVIVSILVIGIDWLVPKKSLGALAGIFFGLLIGILVSWALSFVLTMLNDIYFHMSPEIYQLALGIMAMCICYLSVSLVVRTKDDVRFVIPYVEFSRQAKGLRPLVLDTSVIIDGRIADIAQTKLFDVPLIVPRFVLNELQLIADSADKIKRNRGRRGLDMLNKIQTSPTVEVVIDDTPPPGLDVKADVDHKLVAFCKNCDGRLVTNDFNLNKVAQLRGLDVININDLSNALKTITLPGEVLQIKIIREGEESTQGIGYLEDGTMVVVEGARDKIGQLINLTITSSLQTSAGRMVFGKFESTVRQENSHYRKRTERNQ